MESSQLRKKFLDFFEERGHKIVPSSSLTTDDESVLFTTAGMQQFKPYFTGKNSPFGNKVTSVQKCLRTSDIEEVGDESHLTFFEMLGNFSFGDYFKKQTIDWAIEFLTKEIGLEEKRLWFTYFKGESKIEEDKEAKEILLKISKKRVSSFSKKENFWGPTGEEGPCGPTVEIYYDLEPDKEGDFDPDSSRFIEVWNLVFNQYYQDKENKLSPLKNKGIDTGLGLERLVLVCQKKENVFETDLFLPLVEKIFGPNDYRSRVLADHIKAVVFLAAEGILPQKTGQGYILRRLLRRAIREKKKIEAKENLLTDLAKEVIKIYKEIYPEIEAQKEQVLTIIQKEEEFFGQALERGLKEFKKIISQGTKMIDGKRAFNLYETYSLPLEMIKELAKKEDVKLDVEGFLKAKEEHREISRAGAEKKFGGLGKSRENPKAVKLHTATHLLHSALREIFGDEVRQMGSDVNSERLRFDFSFDRKLTEGEVKKIEGLINKKIKENLKIVKKEMPLDEALNSGALSFFKEKYPERVTVYSIGNFSKEICAGPHVKQTKELGNFKISKQESVGLGIRRIKAVLK